MFLSPVIAGGFSCWIHMDQLDLTSDQLQVERRSEVSPDGDSAVTPVNTVCVMKVGSVKDLEKLMNELQTEALRSANRLVLVNSPFQELLLFLVQLKLINVQHQTLSTDSCHPPSFSGFIFTSSEGSRDF